MSAKPALIEIKRPDGTIHVTQEEQWVLQYGSWLDPGRTCKEIEETIAWMREHPDEARAQAAAAAEPDIDATPAPDATASRVLPPSTSGSTGEALALIELKCTDKPVYATKDECEILSSHGMFPVNLRYNHQELEETINWLCNGGAAPHYHDKLESLAALIPTTYGRGRLYFNFTCPHVSSSTGVICYRGDDTFGVACCSCNDKDELIPHYGLPLDAKGRWRSESSPPESGIDLTPISISPNEASTAPVPAAAASPAVAPLLRKASTPIPLGRYPARMYVLAYQTDEHGTLRKDAKGKPLYRRDKNGNIFWQLDLRILDGPYVDRKLIDHLFFSEHGLSRIRALCISAGFMPEQGDEINLEADALDQTCWWVVVDRYEDYNGKSYARIAQTDGYTRMTDDEARPFAAKRTFALAYAHYGMRVFPCHEIEADGECSCGKLKCGDAGKHPRLTGWPTLATTQEEQIRAWWSRWPLANIGVACGKDSDLTVLDVDGELGRQTLRALELKHGELPETPIALSGSGGCHYYFRYEDGLINKVKFAPGLDIRNQGGLAIGVGSRNRKGTYQWEAAFTLGADGLRPAKMPLWLVEIVKAAQPGKSSGNGKVEAPNPAAMIDGAGRNNELWRMGRSLRAQKLPKEAIRAALDKINQAFATPLEADEYEKLTHNILNAPDSAAFKSGAPPHQQSGAQQNSKGFSLVQAHRKLFKRHLWLLKNRLLIGKLNNLQGDPGDGKSLFCAWLTALVSNGGKFLDGTECEQGNVILLSSEEGLCDDITARLIAAGANFERIKVWAVDGTDNQYPPSFPSQIGRLRELIEEHKARLVIIDPLENFLDEKMDPNANPTIRRALSNLAWLAAQTQTCFLIVHHLSKDPKNKKSKYRGGGSIAITGAARSNLHIGPDPNEPGAKIFAPVKINSAQPVLAWKFRIVDTTFEDDEGTVHAPKIEWLGETTVTADDVLEAQAEDRKRGPDPVQQQAAIDFLCQALGDGQPHNSDQLIEEAKKQGIKKGTLYDAKISLGIKSSKKDFAGGWTWALPPKS